jgi:hypothetical protein
MAGQRLHSFEDALFYLTVRDCGLLVTHHDRILALAESPPQESGDIFQLRLVHGALSGHVTNHVIGKNEVAFNLATSVLIFEVPIPSDIESRIPLQHLNRPEWLDLRHKLHSSALGPFLGHNQ